MGFISSPLQALVKVCSLPLAVVADIATLGKINATKGVLDSACEDMGDFMDGR